jgi:hypothetical protein
MPDLPSHPETGPAGHTDPASGPAIGGWSRRRKALVIAAVVGVLVLFAVLHLTGVLGGEDH